MNLFRHYGGVVVWILAFAVVAFAIGSETRWGQEVVVQPPPVDASRAAPVSVALLPEYAIEGGTGSRRETVERPAFVPTRRPSPPAAPPAAAAPRMQRGQFTLTGTAVVDEKSIAFLREAAGGKARTVRAGETINGLTVAEVKADRVKLVMGSESEELMLKVAAGPRVTIQPPVQGAGQPGAPGAPPGVGGPGPAPAAAVPPPDSDMSILERRRAARAQQAAAAEAARAQAAAQQGQQVDPAQVQPAPVPVPAPRAPITGVRRGVPISQSLQPQ